MKTIDLNTYARKTDFDYSKHVSYPYINVCAKVDITKFYDFIKESNKPFFVSFMYAITKTANDIPEFRYRIRDNHIIEHEQVNPSFKLDNDDIFHTAKFQQNFYRFVEYTLAGIELNKNDETEETLEQKNADDIILVSAILSVSFTSVTYPIDTNSVESIPHFTWGKYSEEQGKLLLPLSIQGHFGLLDGAIIGDFFARLQQLLDSCDTLKVYETDEEEKKAREYNTRIIRSSDLNQRMRSQYPYKD